MQNAICHTFPVRHCSRTCVWKIMYFTSLHFQFTSVTRSLAHSTKVPFDGGVGMDLSVIAKLVPEYSVCALPHAVAFSRRDRRVSRSSVSGHMSNPPVHVLLTTHHTSCRESVSRFSHMSQHTARRCLERKAAARCGADSTCYWCW